LEGTEVSEIDAVARADDWLRRHGLTQPPAGTVCTLAWPCTLRHEFASASALHRLTFATIH
jgi:hypothetical protein